MKYIFWKDSVSRDFYEHFWWLLSLKKKRDLQKIFENEILNNDDFSEFEKTEETLLDFYWISLNEAIHNYLHLWLNVYLEVTKDDIGNTIPHHCTIWIMNNWTFTGIWIKEHLTRWHSLSYYINDEEYIVTNMSEYEKWELEDLLFANLWEINYNNTFLLLKDLLRYEEYLWTYICVKSEFEDLDMLHPEEKRFIYIPLEWTNKYVYINSTMLPPN